MSIIQITFDVADVDPTLVDPLDVAEELFSSYDVEHRAGNAKYTLGEQSLEAEWVD